MSDKEFLDLLYEEEKLLSIGSGSRRVHYRKPKVEEPEEMHPRTKKFLEKPKDDDATDENNLDEFFED